MIKSARADAEDELISGYDIYMQGKRQRKTLTLSERYLTCFTAENR